MFLKFYLKLFFTLVHCVYLFTFDYSTTINSPKILPENTPSKIEYSTTTTTNIPKILLEQTPSKHEMILKKEVKPSVK